MAQAPEGFTVVRRGPMRLYLRHSHAEALLGIQIQRIGEWFESHHWATVSAGRGATVVMRPGLPGGAPLVIKGYRHGGLLGRLLPARYLSPARALRAIAASDTARRAGVPAPLVVAGAAERTFPIGCRLYEVSLEVPGSEPLDRALKLNGGAPAPLPPGVRSRRRLLIEACGRSVRALHDAGIDHRDLNLRNLLAAEGPGGPEVQVIDYDGARIGPPLSARRRLRALRRLLRSAVKLHPQRRPPSLLTLVRWLRAYSGGDRRLEEYLLARRRSFARHVALHRLLWR
jgi:tRNA A-37 threonylcarbamoyl transferase component Bud32